MREHGVGKMDEKGEMFAETCVNNRIVYSHKTIHETTHVSGLCRRKPNRPHLYLQKVQKDHGRRQNKKRSRCNIRSPPPGSEIQIRVKETLVHKKVKGEIQCWIAQQHLSSKEAREHQGMQWVTTEKKGGMDYKGGMGTPKSCLELNMWGRSFSGPPCWLPFWPNTRNHQENLPEKGAQRNTDQLQNKSNRGLCPNGGQQMPQRRAKEHQEE